MSPDGVKYDRRKRSALNLDTWRAKILVFGGMATSLLAIGTLVAVTCNATACNVNEYIDDRASSVYNHRIEPVYREVQIIGNVLRERDSSSYRRGFLKYKRDSIDNARKNMILGGGR